MFSFAAIYYGSVKKRDIGGSLPKLSLCEEDLAMQAFTTKANGGVELDIPQPVVFTHNTSADVLCPQGSYWIQIEGAPPVDSNLTAHDCLDHCVSSNSVDLKCTSPSGVEYPHSTLAGCYCRSKLQQYIAG